ncbi:MAG: hypothetical protein IE933_12420 [Sphingomonadales bacterium]|nr:hypothetical protein [Sphingomonadales bacterium]MBD3774745.1 hypothetical protein [Paracoccaceae bacterium]
MSFPRLKSFALLATGAAALAGCVPAPKPAPPPAATPTRAPAPPPVALPAPPPANWMDAPRTPGDWRYSSTASGSFARYGAHGTDWLFTIQCNRHDRQILLARSGAARADAIMQVRAETAERTLPTKSGASDTAMVVALLGANDPLLDAMALSKGRFAVEVPGLNPLYLPSWSEVSRVIEDCR